MWLFKSETVPPDVLRRRETIQSYLIAGQFVTLAIAGYQLVSGNQLSALTTAVLATCLERMAATALRYFNDADTAQYISEHYSQITQASNVFNPVIDKVTEMVSKDLNSMMQKRK
jgi:hypothetical protein